MILAVVGCGSAGGGGGAAVPDPGDFLTVNGDRPPRPGEDTDDSQGGGGTSSDYLKITLDGTISTHNNQASVQLDPGESLTVFEYISDYSIELWFRPTGGDATVPGGHGGHGGDGGDSTGRKRGAKPGEGGKGKEPGGQNGADGDSGRHGPQWGDPPGSVPYPGTRPDSEVLPRDERQTDARGWAIGPKGYVELQ